MTRSRKPPRELLLGAIVASACVSDQRSVGDAFDTEGSGSVTAAGSSASTTGSSDSGGDTDDFKYDVGDGMGSGGGSCFVSDGLDGVGECEQSAPPDSFQPAVQWTWDAPNGETDSGVIPLVANLTDDNGDGSVDLCDVPDIVVTVTSSFFMFGSGHVYVLDGETGSVHYQLAGSVDPTVTPALGDIDGDGLPEIVAMRYESAGLDFRDRLVAFDHNGPEAWLSDDTVPFQEAAYGAIALADLDADGDVEIMFGNRVFDHTGKQLWAAPDVFPQAAGHAVAAADLDGDGDQEVVLGHTAYHHDGSQYYSNPDMVTGYPQIANLDGDPEPEILLLTTDGINVLEHDGTTKMSSLRPTGDPAEGLTWVKPATVHDFDGDGVSEFATGSANNYSVYAADGALRWSAAVSDMTGSAGGTAFDFLGDGNAEAMYADEHTLFIFDAEGKPYLDVPRSSGTLIEYPVVVDVDNDGSAEIVVVSNFDPDTGGSTAPTVQVIRDEQDRWIQARRIWNQHTYHVTNVREDGTIPQHEPPSWAELNTYRTNAQIEQGGICKPPEG